MTLKTIYGFEASYQECLEKSNLETLHTRREKAFEKFAEKVYEDPCYREKWFEEKKPSRYGLRKEDVVIQNHANCDRLKNAPIYKYREYINKTR